MWPFKEKKKEESQINLGFTGHEVHVNPTPEQRRDRNEARIARLRLILGDLESKGLKDSDKYKMFQNELNYRELQAKVKQMKEG